MDTSFRYIDTELDIDSGFDPAIGPTRSETDSTQYLFRVEPRLELFDGLWEQKLAYWLHDTDRDTNDFSSSFAGSCPSAEDPKRR